MRLSLIFIALLLSSLLTLIAQQVVFDAPVSLGNITAFPDVSNENHYYYLPNQIQLASHANGQPQFSFIRYVRNTGPGALEGIGESGEAGGILHALVMLKVDESDLDEAKREISRVKPGATLRGPIIYRSGKVALISSIANEDGEMTRKVVGIGNAPVLEGSKAAVSVLLTKTGAELLWATFQTPTPDLSFQFEMDAKGYQAPKQVKIEANFEQIYTHTSFEAAAVTPVFAAEIRSAFEELNNSGAIKLTQIGTDEDLDELKDAAYNKLTSLIFDRVGSQSGADFSQLLPNQQQSILDRASNMLNRARTEARTENIRRETQERADEETAFRRGRARSRAALDSIYRARGIEDNPFSGSYEQEREREQEERVDVPSLAVAASFVYKRVRRTGNYIVDLNKYTEETRTFPFSENVGNVNSCEDCFHMFNLDDPLNKQRNIQVRLVDFNANDFEKYLDNVEVVFKKLHQDGQTTVQNVVVNSSRFNENGNNAIIQYGWKGDNNQEKWLDYEFMTKWVFSGGNVIETEWTKSKSGVISLVPPLVKKEIFIELDPDFINQENIRAAEVNLYVENDDQENRQNINFRVSDNILSKSANIILPKDKSDYAYDITWYFKGKDPVTTSKINSRFSNLYLQKLEL